MEGYRIIVALIAILHLNSAVPLHRYWNPKIGDHFYTVNYNEIGGGKNGYKYEGVQCEILQYQHSGSTPLYRYWNGKDHFYTTNINEIGTSIPGQKGNHGYESEGTAGFCYPRPGNGLIPLYRYWNSRITDHFYTTNINEIGTATLGQIGKHGYKSEGVVCYVPSPVPLHRYWNSKIGDHFYTTNYNELRSGKNGWTYEGIQAKILSYQQPGSIPLYRYWVGKDHFYTTNINEIGTSTTGKLGKHGYKSEGTTGYCYPSPAAGLIPLYRYWNSRIVDHFYTTDKNEIGTTTPGQVGKHGFKSEGVACYVYKA